MSTPQPLAPVAPGLLYQAKRELDRQLTDLVPPGKRGMAATVIDKEGVKFGLVAVHRGAQSTIALEAALSQVWGLRAPEFSIKIQAIW